MKPSARKRIVVVVGSSNTDMCVKAPRIPRPGETVSGGEFFMAPGGKGANQAVAAARAVRSPAETEVVLIARVGDDLFGRQALEGFSRDGLRTGSVIMDPSAPSGIALIMIDERGENSIAVAPGANAKLSTADIEGAADMIASASVLLMQLEVPLPVVHRAAEIASSHGVKVILNPAPAKPIQAGDLLKHISILTPNETEVEILTGISIEGDLGFEKAADALLPIGLQAVIITLGAQGAYLAARHGRSFVPAFKVKALDTTAAGDVFNGALAVALSEERTLEEAVRFANAAAALSVTRLGAQPSAPRCSEIEDFLAAAKK